MVITFEEQRMWIKSHQELAEHPKTKRLARQLGVTVPAAIGHLHLLWWWSLKYAPDGNLSRYTPDDLADACMWVGPGDAATYVQALVDARFLDADDDGLSIHDWNEYAGRLLDTKAANAERARTSRARREDVTRTSSGREGLEERRGEEKREEEKRDHASADAEHDAADGGAQDRKLITAAFREEMRVAFPMLDEGDEYERATNHVQYTKAINKRIYYRNWLKRSAASAPARNGTLAPVAPPLLRGMSSADLRKVGTS